MEVIVVGGGAAGFFAAIICVQEHPQARVTILERGAQVLAKVKVSGGGRCNVTHACYEPGLLVQSYPRGGAALRGPFHKFQPRDTVAWFEARGVRLKTEADGRIFPVTDKSQTIIDALTGAAKEAGIRVCKSSEPREIRRDGKMFQLPLASGEILRADRLLLATGGGHQGHAWARALGHTIVPPVPSLFTFNVRDPRIAGLAGLSVEKAQVKILDTDLSQTGPLLITHWGLSGPAVLKLSAWGASHLHGTGYKAALSINWTAVSAAAAEETLEALRLAHPKKRVSNQGPEGMPSRLWERLAGAAGAEGMRWADLTKSARKNLAAQSADGRYALEGKGVFKEEFVTCGGVSLEEVDFRTMESRVCPGLFLAGEILDIDGLTGGFNFQSAWTTGWLAGKAMAR